MPQLNTLLFTSEKRVVEHSLSYGNDLIYKTRTCKKAKQKQSKKKKKKNSRKTYCYKATNHNFCLLLLKSILDEDHNFNKYNHRDIDLLKIPYDFDSIMHYGRKSFSKNGKDTIRSILDPNRPLGQRDGFTDLDVHEINALYDCAGKRTQFLGK